MTNRPQSVEDAEASTPNSGNMYWKKREREREKRERSALESELALDHEWVP